MASKILHLPNYCKLFKDFLVEELIFYESPFEFHFGKCSVIGRLSIRDNLHYLQNISLYNLDKEYRLETGTVEILLLPTFYRSNPTDYSSFGYLVDGLFYEVHGETAFTPKNETMDLKSLTVNTKEMIIKLRMKNLLFAEEYEEFEHYDAKDISMQSLIQFNEDDVQRDVNEFEMNHLPAIQVHTMNEIDRAEKLIHTNLQLRLLRNKRRKNNY